ncbi:MAG: ABC transporter substrate-binding protein [Epulopiscium sp.]|nr:ABC transporter substrate-binding protein [Candidatus Epulonipiscium sp.]
MKKYLSILLIFMILGTATIFTGCAKENTAIGGSGEVNKEGDNLYPIVLTDAHGREITIEKEPQKIISVNPDITEIIFALGEQQRLTGKSDYCDYPEEVQNIESVGGIDNPSIEKIAELKPDIVLASRIFTREADAKLQELNIQVLILDSNQSFEGIYDTITTMGQILNVSPKAEAMVTDMKDKVQNVIDKVKDEPKPSIYYVVGFGEAGDYTAGGDTFIGKMIEMAGGENAARDLEGWQYSLEKIVEQNPDILICSKYYDAKSGIENAQGYKDLSAVKGDRLLEIDNNLLDRQGPRVAQGLEELAKLIHPELFN